MQILWLLSLTVTQNLAITFCRLTIVIISGYRVIGYYLMIMDVLRYQETEKLLLEYDLEKLKTLSNEEIQKYLIDILKVRMDRNFLFSYMMWVVIVSRKQTEQV